jgi:hypothetical protein
MFYEEVSASIETSFGERALEKVQAQEGLIIHESAQRVILYTLVAWGIIIGIVVLAILTMNYFAKEYRQRSFSYALFLEIMTVFLLTGTILVLGIAGKLNQEGLAAFERGHDNRWEIGDLGESPNPLSVSDLTDWEANYGMVAPLSATSTAVPEPASTLLLLLAVSGTYCKSRQLRGVSTSL